MHTQKVFFILGQKGHFSPKNGSTMKNVIALNLYIGTNVSVFEIPYPSVLPASYTPLYCLLPIPLCTACFLYPYVLPASHIPLYCLFPISLCTACFPCPSVLRLPISVCTASFLTSLNCLFPVPSVLLYSLSVPLHTAPFLY